VNGQKLHGTMDEIQNIKGLTNEQRFWVAKLTVGLGAKNVDISTNSNGNLALKFTCSDAKCVQGGRQINDTYGGTETFVGGEGTDACDNAKGAKSGYFIASPHDAGWQKIADSIKAANRAGFCGCSWAGSRRFRVGLKLGLKVGFSPPRR
jgi:hypothetical protein